MEGRENFDKKLRTEEQIRGLRKALIDVMIPKPKQDKKEVDDGQNE